MTEVMTRENSIPINRAPDGRIYGLVPSSFPAMLCVAVLEGTPISNNGSMPRLLAGHFTTRVNGNTAIKNYLELVWNMSDEAAKRAPANKRVDEQRKATAKENALAASES